MPTLLIFRHAKSGHEDGLPDHERTLSPRGRKDAKRMGAFAREQGLVPDRVLCSTAVRARETLERFVDGARYEGPIQHLESLYLAEPAAYVRALADLGDSAETVMVVGHNPGLEALLFELTGVREDLPTATLVECSLPVRTWSDLSGETKGSLRKTFRPKDID